MIFAGFSFAVTNAVLFLTAREATPQIVRPVVAVHHVAEWKPEKRAPKHVFRGIQSLHRATRHVYVRPLILRAARVAGRALARQSHYVIAKLRSDIDMFRAGRVQIAFHEFYAVAAQCLRERVTSQSLVDCARQLGAGPIELSTA